MEDILKKINGILAEEGYQIQVTHQVTLVPVPKPAESEVKEVEETPEIEKEAEKTA